MELVFMNRLNAQEVTPATIVGTWTIEKGQPSSFTFRNDSTVTFKLLDFGINATGHWELRGDTVALTTLTAMIPKAKYKTSPLQLASLIVWFDENDQIRLKGGVGVYRRIDSDSTKSPS